MLELRRNGGLAGLAFVVAAAISATAAPAAPTLMLRLKDSVSTTGSKPGDSIDAVSITPLVVDGRLVATPGCTMPGVVVESLRPKGINSRESVALKFSSLVDGGKVAYPVTTKLIEVDNGRETVDQDGRILGVVPVEKKPDNAGDVLKVAANGTQIMRALVSKVIGKVPPQIDYKSGTELLLRVTEIPNAPSIICGPMAPELQTTDELSKMVNALPLRSMTPDGNRPSDETNLIFIGTHELLDAAFAASGWVTAEALNATSGAKTFFATVAGEGYSEAPVSLQHIDGREPDAVFQKQLNTFAKRHHVRIWKSDDTFDGQLVWIAAATHDNAFVVSKEVKLFNHSIDPNIDDERLKIVNDLAFAGAVASHTLVARPKAPKETTTSTGETIRTDGKAAVIVLQKPAKK